jgi:hypothetical protein
MNLLGVKADSNRPIYSDYLAKENDQQSMEKIVNNETERV